MKEPDWKIKTTHKSAHDFLQSGVAGLIVGAILGLTICVSCVLTGY